MPSDKTSTRGESGVSHSTSAKEIGYDPTTPGDWTTEPTDVAEALDEVRGAGGGGLANVVEDVTPQLGGNLDVNGQSIVSAAAGDIAITPDGAGDLILDGQKWPQAAGAAATVLTCDGTNAAWTAPAVPTTITVANESADPTCFPLFVTAATGNLAPKTNAALTFNADTGAIATTVGFLTPLLAWVDDLTINLSNAATKTLFITNTAAGSANLDVANDIIVGGLVDGVDVAAHAADTVDPHGAVMTVSTGVITPLIAATGSMTINLQAAGTTTLAVGNATGGQIANITIDGGIGFYGTAASTKKTVTGSRGGNAALASLLTQLAAYGLITDSSS